MFLTQIVDIKKEVFQRRYYNNGSNSTANK